MRRIFCLIALLGNAACDDGGASTTPTTDMRSADSGADGGVETQGLTIIGTAEAAAGVAECFTGLDFGDQLEVEVSESPALRPETILIEPEPLDCTDCYRFEARDGGLSLAANGPLGLCYGLTALLEAGGARFFHPRVTHLPPVDYAAVSGVTTGLIEPEMAIRGLHMHTLHPIEGMYAMLMPSEDHLARAYEILLWVVRNRGNYIQWPGLDDIQGNAETRAAWAAHSGAIIARAHTLGLTVGYGVQLFGASNLQNAFDLVEGNDDDVASSVAERMAFLRTDPPFDEFSLSFGEFFGAEPADFVAATNTAVETMLTAFPDAAVNTVIHVGEDQRVDFMGENLIYYFLVKFADPRLIHYVHTVMYYGLFDDAGGAYHHDDFEDHKAHLQQRIRDGEPVAYFPESAYWVAFDVSVPIWLPLYVFMRHRDAIELKKEGTPLPGHTLFSSGWEWGYWQFDYSTLRFNHTVPDDWRDLYRDMFTPWGDAGAALAEQAVAMTEAQYRHLVQGRLGAYLAGRDIFIDIGDMRDIIAQPDRVQLSEVADLDAAGRMALADDIAGMEALADEMRAVAEAIDAIEWPDDSPWHAEMQDGAWVTVHRADYIAALYRVALAAADGADTSMPLAVADAAQDAARIVVERRHAALHDAEMAETYRTRNPNPSLYKFGYLHHADTLCYWDRERGKVGEIIDEAWDTPACGL